MNKLYIATIIEVKGPDCYPNILHSDSAAGLLSKVKHHIEAESSELRIRTDLKKRRKELYDDICFGNQGELPVRITTDRDDTQFFITTDIIEFKAGACEYRIIRTSPDGKKKTVGRIHSADILPALTGLRSEAFDLAASGRHGIYPFDDTFNDAVESGFNPDGTVWRAKDDTVLSIVMKRQHTQSKQQ